MIGFLIYINFKKIIKLPDNLKVWHNVDFESLKVFDLNSTAEGV